MRKLSFSDCFAESRLILTEGAVGQRVEREFGLEPDPDIKYAGLIYDRAGRAALSSIYGSYLTLAEEFDLPIMLMTNTRRANRERVERSKFSERNVMRDYADFLRELSAEFDCSSYIGGMMGCRGDAYSGAEGLKRAEAVSFHSWQLEMFILGGLDFLFAGIMPALPETIGMAEVMSESGLPYIISLMVSPDGNILDGHSINEAIFQIDRLAGRLPLCYMTNCVHPSILEEALSAPENQSELVRKRFCGIQANAARFSPEVLDNSGELLSSPARDLAAAFASLGEHFPLKIYGGCCGTDERHMREMVRATATA